jgi:hypothetical protein
MVINVFFFRLSNLQISVHLSFIFVTKLLSGRLKKYYFIDSGAVGSRHVIWDRRTFDGDDHL